MKLDYAANPRTVRHAMTAGFLNPKAERTWRDEGLHWLLTAHARLAIGMAARYRRSDASMSGLAKKD